MSSPDNDALPDLQPLPGKQTGAEVSQAGRPDAAAAGARRLPLGSRADPGHPGPLPGRGDLRGGGRHRRRHVTDHREELGDLLLQVVFQSELRHAEGAFGIDDVARGIVAKLVRRHPHVFGEVKAQNADEALASWAKLKAAEKAKKGKKRRARRRCPAARRRCLRRQPRRRRRPAPSASTGRTPPGPARRWTRSWASWTVPWPRGTRRNRERAGGHAVRGRQPGASSGSTPRGAARRHRPVSRTCFRHLEALGVPRRPRGAVTALAAAQSRRLGQRTGVK